MALPASIGGRYVVERSLGEGGMGRVLLARDEVLGRRVAVKILRDDLGLPPELKDQLALRMRQEARAAAALSHPAMVTLHDMGEDEGVGLFLVFEWIDGVTLRDRLAHGPLATADVAAMARALGSALTHAHAAGVVHRDVKPENVMLPRAGAAAGAKLTDFGIARLPDSTLTRSSTVLGTPAYNAPEALAKGEYGPASDQFSLAATLYEALSGRRAFGPGDDALETATRVAIGKQAPVAMLPGLRAYTRLDAVLDRALAKTPHDRYSSCEAFGDALATELDKQVVEAPPASVPRSIVPRATRRWQNLLGLAGVVVIGTLVALGNVRSSSEGVSLKSAASAFSSALAPARGAMPSPAAHRPHPSASSAPSSFPSGAAPEPSSSSW